jgi:hypothetical protein
MDRCIMSQFAGAINGGISVDISYFRAVPPDLV